MRRPWLLILGWLLWPASILAATVQLSWNPSIGATGYLAYYGSASRSYEVSVDVGQATSAVIEGFSYDGQTRYFAVTAYNAAGESDFSHEVSVTFREPDPQDTTPPHVAIISPADGSTVPRKGEVTIVAEASDADSGIARVELYVNGALLCTDVLAPFQCPWRVPAAGGGKRYMLEALAINGAGHEAVSPPVVVTAR